ncbi:MAG TPA: putative lipid II flippase FtsW [Dehalococcoidia bacterium]|nr:putative lipid II flippase FtsW [Dehalococcoidia bacterium]
MAGLHELRRLRELRAPRRALPHAGAGAGQGGGAIAAVDGALGYRQAGGLRPGPPDYLLLVATAMLLIVGLLAVYSASFAVGYLEFGDTNYFVARQAIFALVGLAALVFFMRLDYNRLRTLSVPFMLAALVGLLAVLVPGLGATRNGASRWLELGPVAIQPSEFAKLAVIIYISAWLASRGSQISHFSLGFVPFVLMISVVGGLVIAEPDMGTTIIILLVASTLFFVAGAPLSHLGLLIGAGGLVAWGVIVSKEYQMDRLVSFVDPQADPQGLGFHIIQLLIALGSGGPLGLGWGASRQKFFYVPGAHTDGVFAILGEELGFIGLLAILALFGFFLYRGVRVTLASPDRFATLLGIGIVSWIAYQTLINIGGITRTIPLTGVPLPFLSYGGSALISVMAGVGVLLSLSRYARGASYGEREGGRPRRRAGAPRGFSPRRGPA